MVLHLRSDHSNLSSLNFNRLNSVINDSFLALKKKIGHVSHFSFPYGTNSHFTEDAREIVSKAEQQQYEHPAVYNRRPCKVNKLLIFLISWI